MSSHPRLLARRLAGALLLTALITSGCANAQNQKPADNERDYRSALDRKLAALRSQIAEQGVTPELALAYANLARGVYRADVREGRETAPEVIDQAVVFLHAAAEEHPDEALQLHYTSAALYELIGHPAGVARELLIAIELKPSTELLRGLLALARGESVDRAVVEACSATRDLVPDHELLDFLLVCYDAAGDDPERLEWTAVELDLVELRELLQRHEPADHDELRRLARARLFSERRHDLLTVAGVLGLGLCHQGNCLRRGWTGASLQGEVMVRCRGDGCLRGGWDVNLPGEQVAHARCVDEGSCLRDGWRVSLPDGTAIETRCMAGGCEVQGWTTTLPNGVSYETLCADESCLEVGWSTEVGDQLVTCECARESCMNHGASCQREALAREP